MATLVLTVAGSAVGGPIGGAIGAALGGAIDRTVLFRPPGREGPRLKELALQTSSYGTQIPKLFGTIRVAGSVIWATDLIEHRSSSGGGKGAPSTTSYSYTASFAVALSARPIRAVRRIWAEGKLLRGAAGDFKVQTGFRLYRGTEDQPVDPLISAAEGLSQAPAHRGIAYAVFEHLQLAEFGNRIPALTFEVEADDGRVGLGAIAASLAPQLVRSEAGMASIGGFSAHGASTRAVLETLGGAANGWFVERAGEATLARGEGEAVEIEDAGVRAAGAERSRGSRTIGAADGTPRSLTLTHYDPAREYQLGMQRASRPGAGTREMRVELPAVLEAGAAKTLAAEALSRMELERERRIVTLGWEGLAIGPGARVRIAGVPGQWRVDRWNFEAMTVRLECVRIAPAPVPRAASSGRAVGAPDLTAGETIVHAFELPPLDDAIAAAPRIAVAAAGSGTGWRSASLLLSTDGGGRWDPIGTTGYPATLGAIVVSPGAGCATLIDRANSLEVVLAHEGMMPADADAAALCAGANLALVGDELLQFGRAEPLGGARWRLSELWRGRRGTEHAIGTQVAGDRFTLLTADALRTAELPIEALGSQVRLLAQGVGDTVAVEAEAEIRGLALLPPSPVHLAARPLPEGGAEVSWIRRSRAGWRWIDASDAPLAEEDERYRVTITPDGAPERIVTVREPAVAVASAERAAGCVVTVRQIGMHGVSRPAQLRLEPDGGSE